jgi:hypothetical protein
LIGKRTLVLCGRAMFELDRRGAHV